MIKRKNLQICMGILATGMLLALNACGDTRVGEHVSGNVEHASAATETTSATEVTKELEQQGPTGESIEGCIIQEDEQYLYFCGGCRVSKVNKETSEETVLWENAQQVAREKEYLFSRGSGVLIEDTIYFIEVWIDENDNF